jgi:hypothetical protein
VYPCHMFPRLFKKYVCEKSSLLNHSPFFARHIPSYNCDFHPPLPTHCPLHTHTPTVYCALLTFLHQRVWCPRQQRMVHLAPLNEQSRAWLRAAGLGSGNDTGTDNGKDASTGNGEGDNGDGDLAFLGAYVFGFIAVSQTQSECTFLVKISGFFFLSIHAFSCSMNVLV